MSHPRSLSKGVMFSEFWGKEQCCTVKENEIILLVHVRNNQDPREMQAKPGTHKKVLKSPVYWRLEVRDMRELKVTEASRRGDWEGNDSRYHKREHSGGKVSLGKWSGVLGGSAMHVELPRSEWSGARLASWVVFHGAMRIRHSKSG